MGSFVFLHSNSFSIGCISFTRLGMPCPSALWWWPSWSLGISGKDDIWITATQNSAHLTRSPHHHRSALVTMPEIGIWNIPRYPQRTPLCFFFFFLSFLHDFVSHFLCKMLQNRLSVQCEPISPGLRKRQKQDRESKRKFTRLFLLGNSFPPLFESLEGISTTVVHKHPHPMGAMAAFGWQE